MQVVGGSNPLAPTSLIVTALCARASQSPPADDYAGQAESKSTGAQQHDGHVVQSGALDERREIERVQRAIRPAVDAARRVEFFNDTAVGAVDVPPSVTANDAVDGGAAVARLRGIAVVWKNAGAVLAKTRGRQGHYERRESLRAAAVAECAAAVCRRPALDIDAGKTKPFDFA